MRIEQARQVLATVERDYAGRIEARITFCHGRYAPSKGSSSVRVALRLVGRNLLYDLQYPTQLRKALEAWAIFLLTPEQLEAILNAPWPFPDEDGGRRKKELQEAS